MQQQHRQASLHEEGHRNTPRRKENGTELSMARLPVMSREASRLEQYSAWETVPEHKTRHRLFNKPLGVLSS